MTQIKAAVNAAITAYQSIISSKGTANILFDVMATGLGRETVEFNIAIFYNHSLIILSVCSGSSNTYFVSKTYQSYRLKLTTYSSSTNDQTALAYLPNQLNEPVMNTQNMWVKTALARTLGYNIAVAQDSTVSINFGICNLNRTYIDPKK